MARCRIDSGGIARQFALASASLQSAQHSVGTKSSLQSSVCIRLCIQAGNLRFTLAYLFLQGLNACGMGRMLYLQHQLNRKQDRTVILSSARVFTPEEKSFELGCRLMRSFGARPCFSSVLILFWSRSSTHISLCLGHDINTDDAIVYHSLTCGQTRTRP